MGDGQQQAIADSPTATADVTGREQEAAARVRDEPVSNTATPTAGGESGTTVAPRSRGDVLGIFTAPVGPLPPVMSQWSLPEVRAQLITYLEGPVATAQCHRREDKVGRYVRPWGSSWMTVDDVRLAHRDRLAAAVLFAATPDAVAGARMAAGALGDEPLREEDLPAPTGFLYFEHPLAHRRSGHHPLVAVCWQAATTGVFISLWGYGPEDLLPPEAITGWKALPPHGLSWDGDLVLAWNRTVSESVACPGHGYEGIGRAVVGLWRLMRRGLVTETAGKPDRAERRRRVRAGVASADVGVLTVTDDVTDLAGHVGAADRSENDGWDSAEDADDTTWDGVVPCACDDPVDLAVPRPPWLPTSAVTERAPRGDVRDGLRRLRAGTEEPIERSTQGWGNSTEEERAAAVALIAAHLAELEEAEGDWDLWCDIANDGVDVALGGTLWYLSADTQEGWFAAQATYKAELGSVASGEGGLMGTAGPRTLSLEEVVRRLDACEFDELADN